MLSDTLSSTVTYLGNSVSTCSLISAANTALSESEDKTISVYRKSDRNFEQSTDSQSVSDIMFTPKDLEKGTFLKPLYYVLNNGLVFNDKLLPDPSEELIPDHCKFNKEYYVNLHYKVSEFSTYNHLGARIPLEHCKLNVEKFRELLPYNYDDRVVIQYMEFGFPLGLQEDF